MKLQLPRSSLWRGRRQLLQGLDVSIQPGQCWALLGENGSGKSSLLLALADAEADLRFVGAPQWQPALEGLREKALWRSLARQQVDPAPGLRVFDVLALASTAVPACARAWRLEGLLSCRLSELSGGQLQRLELARSWAQIEARAGLWLLDEPFNHLDMRAQIDLSQHIRAYCQAGGAVMFSSHALAPARRLASAVLMLAAGEQLACGDVRLLTDARLLERLYGVAEEELATLRGSGLAH